MIYQSAAKGAVEKGQTNSQTSSLLAVANQAVIDHAIPMGQSPAFVMGDVDAIPTLKEMSEKILAVYKSEYELLSEQSPLEHMARCLENMQQLKYYGSYFYSVKELSSSQVKDADSAVPLRELDEQNELENPSYWICIDLEGITILGKDRKASV